MRQLVLLALMVITAYGQTFPFPGPVGASHAAVGPCTPVSGYSHCRVLTVDHTQTGGSTLTNFPVVLRATLGGGKITNASCYDVVYTSDSGGTTLIPWEQESCNSSTGSVVHWVLCASCSSTADTLLYQSYGNAGVSAAQNSGANVPTQVWGSYAAVYHLNDPSFSNLDPIRDSTANANTATVHGGGWVSGAELVNGGLNEGVGFTSNYAALASAITLPTTYTVSGWVRAPINDSYFNLLFHSTGYPGGVYFQSGNIKIQAADGSLVVQSYGVLTSGTWYLFSVVSDVSHNLTIYINGSVVGTGSVTAGLSVVAMLGYPGDTAPLQGESDELNLTSIARSSGWITAQVNSQQVSSTFVGIGVEH